MGCIIEPLGELKLVSSTPIAGVKVGPPLPLSPELPTLLPLPPSPELLSVDPIEELSINGKSKNGFYFLWQAVKTNTIAIIIIIIFLKGLLGIFFCLFPWFCFIGYFLYYLLHKSFI
jgi:hypothetical protein